MMPNNDTAIVRQHQIGFSWMRLKEKQILNLSHQNKTDLTQILVKINIILRTMVIIILIIKLIIKVMLMIVTIPKNR